MSSRLPPLSNTERASVVASLIDGVRLDGRSLLENRDVSIKFGKDFGSCTVTLGSTRVLATVACEVVEPRPSRPNAGKIATSVHITPMAGQEFEIGRTSDVQDELEQLLNNNIVESRCIDTEALCIKAEESVWQLRADVTVLNNAGSLCDACNMAVVAALKHFHRPDVTVEEDGRVTVHSFTEREPIPTHLKKIPVCLTYAFCEVEDRLIVFCDPTILEERVVRGRLVVGLNPHGEITSMNYPGPIWLGREHIKDCISNAFKRAKFVANIVEQAVEQDLALRRGGATRGYTDPARAPASDPRAGRERVLEAVAVMRGVADQLRGVRAGFEREEMEGIEVKTETVSSSSDEFSDSSEDDSSDEEVPAAGMADLQVKEENLDSEED